MVQVIAHRGASGYAPENTLSAFEKALKLKADYIELDVQMSKDKKLIVMHDITLDRTTNGIGKVGSFSLEELKALEITSRSFQHINREKIPTLEEVLQRYWGKIGILIELKAPWLYPGIERELAKTLKEYLLHQSTSKLIVQSFDHKAMMKLHKLLPKVPIGVIIYKQEHLTYSKLKELATFADYINPRADLVTFELIQIIHQLGLKMMIWTLEDPAEVHPFILRNVDGIITDYPDKGWKGI